MNSFAKTSLAAAVVLAGGAFFHFSGSGGGTASDGPVYEVQSADLVQQVTVAGNIEPQRKTIVTAPFDGYVKRLFVRIGQKVKEGDPLVSISQSLQSSETVFPLRAPFAGTVVQVRKNEGEFIRQSDSEDFILRVDQLDTLVVNAAIPEIDVVKVKVGQNAVIKASAILDKTYKGVIREIALASTPQDRWRDSKVEYQARVEISDADGDVKSGMSAVVDILTNRKESVLIVPHEYIYKEGDRYFVFSEREGKKEIQVGLSNETDFEVTDGLKDGEVLRQIDFLSLIGEEASSSESPRDGRKKRR